VIIDGHVTVGRNRDVELSVHELLTSMDRLGIDFALVSPPESLIPVGNREGNELVAAAAAGSAGSLRAYAVATPWLGEAAIEELRRARDAGAVALKLDPSLQGFDLLDGLVDALVEFAAEAAWPVYVRSGTPPHSLPLQLATLAQRHQEVTFVLGKSGATDFSADGPVALADAQNVVADSAHVEWPTRRARERPDEFGARVVFTTDAPFASPDIELARVTEAGLAPSVLEKILGGTIAALVGWCLEA
jgi:uncharacterized protein